MRERLYHATDFQASEIAGTEGHEELQAHEADREALRGMRCCNPVAPGEIGWDAPPFEDRLTRATRGGHTGYLLQAIFNKVGRADSPPQPSRQEKTLLELREGESGVIQRLELPEEVAARLMRLGLAPGSRVSLVRRAPGGDPRVYQVDGAEIALRCETAAHLILQSTPEPDGSQ